MTLRMILLTLGLLTLPRAMAAHDIPNDVTVQLYVHPDPDRLIVLVRAPLEAMRDIDWPTRGPGYLELDQTDELVGTAARLWLANDIAIFENGRRTPEPAVAGVRVAIPSDPAFRTWESAQTRFDLPPLDGATELIWQQALLDVRLEYPITSERSEFSIRPALERLGLSVLTLIHFVSADGTERVFQFGESPGRVILDPRWHQAALNFVRFGFAHIIGGWDHILFLLCLVIPLRRLRPLITVVTAFTLAHSITLVASAYSLSPDTLWFPPLIETLIAASILYMAIGNVIQPDVEHRWLLAFGFGLVHGFGFSFALADTMQLAGKHLPTALFSFNVGVELGQILVLALLVPSIQLVLKLGRSEQIPLIVLSVLVGHTAWHWMVERGGALMQYSWEGLRVPTLPTLLRWTLLAVIVVGSGWAFSLLTQTVGYRGRGEVFTKESESP